MTLIRRISTRFGESRGKLDRRRARRVLNPYARESKTRTERFLKVIKLISDHGILASYEGLHGAANDKTHGVFFRDTQGFELLGVGSRAGFTSSRPPQP